MSEEKTIKHTKQAVSLMHNKSVPLKEKLKGLFEEIIVIIIAVSITLMLHNWNDNRRENEIATNFLTGVKTDLKNGAGILTKSIKRFQPTIDYYNTVLKQIKAGKIDAQYVDTLSWNLRNTSYFVFDDSRFEGFKSSGYLRLIKNEELLKKLVTLYSIELPFEKETDANFFQSRQRDFDNYIGVKAGLDTAGNFMVSKMLNDRAVFYQYFNYAQILEERKKHREYIITKMNILISEIDKELQK